MNSKSRNDFMELDRFPDDDLPQMEQASQRRPQEALGRGRNKPSRVRSTRHNISHANILSGPSRVYSDHDRRITPGISHRPGFSSVRTSDHPASEVYRRCDGGALSQERSRLRWAAECDIRQCDGTPNWNIRASAGLIEVVKASITGSLVGNLLLVLGTAIFAGGAIQNADIQPECRTGEFVNTSIWQSSR